MALADFIKNQIDLSRANIGRNVDVYTPILSPCTLCQPSGYFDALGNCSFFTVCPVCVGSYWLNTVQKTEVLARVHWVSNEAITATPGGKYFLGEAWATVDPVYHDLFVQANNESGKVVVDNQDMQIIQIRPMGAPSINRIRIILKSMGDRPNY